jgi:hypothetical protein
VVEFSIPSIGYTIAQLITKLQVSKAMTQDENFNNDFLSIYHLPCLIALDNIGFGTLRIIGKNFA